jgi:hypothetical protein
LSGYTPSSKEEEEHGGTGGEEEEQRRREENIIRNARNLPAEMLIVLGWQKSGSVVVEKWWHVARFGDLVSEMWAPWVC